MENLNLILIVAVILFFLLKRLSFVKAELAQKLASEGATILDVRSKGEFKQGSVNSAINMPVEDLSKEIEGKIPDKKNPLLVFCLSGTRSAIACRILKSKGYQNVHNLGSLRRAKKILENQT